MNLALIRTILRRRINDVPGDVWADADLNSIIIQALQRLQIDILKVDPEAFLRVDQCATVAGQIYYSKPTNMVHEVALLILQSDGVTYQRIERRDYNQILERAAQGSSPQSTIYAHMGRYFVLDPPPASTAANALRLVHVPALTLAADTDNPAIQPQTLHYGVVLYADSFIQGETGEGASAAAQKTSLELKSLLDSIPQYYRRSAADEQKVRIDLSKGY